MDYGRYGPHGSVAFRVVPPAPPEITKFPNLKAMNTRNVPKSLSTPSPSRNH